MFSAKRARATNEQGTGAERLISQERKPYWKADSALLRQLLILSTFQPLSVRRSYLRTLLICFVIRKYSASRKLGRLFRIPSMNLSTTWTSRELWMGQGCSEMTHTPSLTDSSKNSLRSVQKTSGLFNSVNASNTTVASMASKPAALDLDKMEVIPGFVPDEDLGGIIADMPFDLTEEDYLDRFMDLSNFLLPENSKGSIMTVDSVVDNGKVKESIPTDFSGIISHLASEPFVIKATPEVESSTSSSLGKRKHVEYEEVVVVDDFVINVVDQPVSGECLMADHDYVTKKPKLADPVTPVKVSHVTTTSQTKDAPLKKPMDKYRERRDKNNEASRRSRQIRKQKFVDMDEEASELEIKNEGLRKKIVELEELAKTMKAILIKKMTEK